jgi:hypothetical protein
MFSKRQTFPLSSTSKTRKSVKLVEKVAAACLAFGGEDLPMLYDGTEGRDRRVDVF